MQTTGIRLFVLVYLSFFLALSIRTICESIASNNWTGTEAPSASVLVALAALSGWLSKAMGLMNFVLGLSGGFFNAASDDNDRWGQFLRHALFWLMVLMIIVSLLALLLVALASTRIAKLVSELEPDSVSAAIEALGTLNLGLVAGFLTGLAIANVPGVLSGGAADGE